MDLSAFLDEFRAEAGDHLRSLDDHLLRLERDPSDPEPIRAMFLSAHTIKGGASMMGLDEARELAHALEDVLGYLRDHREPLDSETADLLFRALDALRELVERSSPGALTPGVPVGELVGALRGRAGEQMKEAGGPSPEEAAHPGAPRALLVDDSPTVRLLEKMLLSDAGYLVDEVADGREALALARANPYRLVVTGIEIRGLRGLDLVEALRDSTTCQQLPIIVMSSNDSAEQRHRAAELGVQAFLQKGSLRQQQLVEAARGLLEP